MVSGEIIYAMTKKIKVIAITGIRSDYDLMSSTYKALSKDNKFDFRIIVTGAHCLAKFGKTLNEIKKDKIKILKIIKSLSNPNQIGSRAISLGIQLQKITKTIIKFNPDFIFSIGDREESLTASIIGSYIDKPVVHISGGDRVVGNVDDQIRHAVSKMSHLHFTTNISSSNRLIKMGEQSFRVKNLGHPGLERLKNEKKLSLMDISKKIQFSLKKPYLMLIYHPLSSEKKLSKKYMLLILDAINDLKLKTVIIFPNSDEGNNGVIEAINKYKKNKNFKIFKHLPRNLFINLLRNTNCLVGNSSCGILEAPFLKLPAVNIGNRQKERVHAKNVKFVSHDKKKIKKTIKNIIYGKKFKKQISKSQYLFGKGDTSKKIMQLLKKIKINKKLLIKDITY